MLTHLIYSLVFAPLFLPSSLPSILSPLSLALLPLSYQWNTFFGLDQFGQVPEPSPDDENNSVTAAGTEPGQGLGTEPGPGSTAGPAGVASGPGLGESSLDGGTSMGDLTTGDV